jgi:hypothetical protein
MAIGFGMVAIHDRLACFVAEPQTPLLFLNHDRLDMIGLGLPPVQFLVPKTLKYKPFM